MNMQLARPIEQRLAPGLLACAGSGAEQRARVERAAPCGRAVVVDERAVAAIARAA
jgi:hypothetical protein